MPSDPSTLFAPVRTAYPKYAALLDALAGLIASDAPGPSIVEGPPAPVVPVVPPAVAPDHSLIAGQPLFLDNGGSLFRFDFGDPAGRFNALRGYNAVHVYDSPGNYSLKIGRDVPSTALGTGPSTALGTGQSDSTQTVRVSSD